MRWLDQYLWLNGHEFEQTLGDSEGQESLACCSPWGHRVRHDLAREKQQQGDYMTQPNKIATDCSVCSEKSRCWDKKIQRKSSFRYR